MDPQSSAPTNNASVTNSAAPAPPAAAPATPLNSIPDTWPGASGLYKYSKQAVKQNLGALIVIWFLNFGITIVIELFLKQIGEIIAIILGSLVTAALMLVLIASVRNQHVSIGEALSGAVPLWLKMIGLQILVGISVILSGILFIIPIFFVLPRLMLSYYFLVDKRMGVIEAYKASWHASKGNTGKVWGIIGMTILMALLMVTIIGIPFSIYFLLMYAGAFAVLYEFLNKTQPGTAAPAAASVAPAPPTASPMPPAGAPPVVQ
jgi:hypothetical protein